MKIVIVDYGIGNVRSIYNAFSSQGLNPILSNNSEFILNADGLFCLVLGHILMQ